MTNDPHTIDSCVSLLEALVADRARLAELSQDQRKRLLVAAGRLSHPDRLEQRQFSRPNGKPFLIISEYKTWAITFDENRKDIEN